MDFTILFRAAVASAVRRGRRTLQMRVNKIVQISRADIIRHYCALFPYSLLLITLSEAKQTPQSRLCRASSPTGEPNKFYDKSQFINLFNHIMSLSI